MISPKLKIKLMVTGQIVAFIAFLLLSSFLIINLLF